MTTELTKLEKEIARLTEQRNAVLAAEMADAAHFINEKIALYGFQPKDLQFGPARVPRRKLQHTQVKAIKAKEAAAKKSNGIEKVKPARRTATKPVKKVNGKLPPKYQLGDKTWSGFARKPAWVQQHLAKGGTLEAIQIQ